MKFAAVINIIVVLTLAVGLMSQHHADSIGTPAKSHTMSGYPANSGNFSSHELLDIGHTDDIISEVPKTIEAPVFILFDDDPFQLPARVISGSSPCWQPPESRF